MQYRDKHGKLIRKIPRVRCGNKDAVAKQLAKIDTGDYFQKRKKGDDDDDDSEDDETDDESEVDDEDETDGECSESKNIPLQEDQNQTQSQISDCPSSSDQPPNRQGKEKDISISSTKSQAPPDKSRKSQNDTANHPSEKSGGRHGGKFTSKNVPYTRTGDAGTSVLLTGERRSKDDDAFEAMGTVDELCSIVGVVHAEIMNVVDAPEEYAELENWLLDVMSRLFDIGSHVAKPRQVIENGEGDGDCDEAPVFRADGVGNGFDIDHVYLLEEWIDHMTEDLPELTSFILPTGSKVAAQLHVARCVCRRAERVVLPLVRKGVCDPNAAKYLNRLSDFLFSAARWSNFCDGLDEVQYRRPIRGAKQRNRVNISLREEKKVE